MGAPAEHSLPLPSWHYEEPPHLQQPRAHMPLHEALAKCYDLRCLHAAQMGYALANNGI